MDACRWSQLAVLCRNARRLQTSSGGGNPGCTVHHRRTAVPGVSAAVPRLPAEQSPVDVARPCGAEVRSAALLCVGTEVA